MKFATFTLVLSFLSLNLWAAPNLDQKISITAHQVQTEDAIKQISEKFGVNFIISEKIFATRPISIDVQDANLRDVLDFLATELHAKWAIGQGNTIQFSSLE